MAETLHRRDWMIGAGTLLALACKQSLPEPGETPVNTQTETPNAPPPAAAVAPAGSGLAMVDTAVSDYCADHTVPESPVMKAIAEETRADIDMWIMMVGPMEAALLRLMVQLTNAKRVLEVGTFTGYSAIAMAEGMADGGKLITLDINEEWAAIARKHWAKSPHGKKIELKLGPAADTLEKLDGPFDVAFIDADKGGYPAYWDAIVPKMRRGGLVICDNVLAGGSVAQPDSAHARAMAAFNDKVRADKRVRPLMLPIRDGVTIARVGTDSL